MIREMIQKYQKSGLARDLSAACVCQDVILKAIAEGPLSRNATIKGGVVMYSITGNNRRATRDIDIDFIHYSLSDDSIRTFIDKLNRLNGINITLTGEIEELKHQDYHGKCVHVVIKDDNGVSISSKIDIGVHKHFEIEQEEYVFDVCMDESGVSLLKNSAEQTFTEKLRSLLIFGPNSRRYKDIFDMYYLKDVVRTEKLKQVISVIIFNDSGIRESTYADIERRVSSAFQDMTYLSRLSSSRQRWINEDIHIIANGILVFIQELSDRES